MKTASLTQIENLRQLRFAVTALETANSAVCAAQTQIRNCGSVPAIDLAAAVQAEQRTASKNFRAQYDVIAKKLDDDGAAHLHAAVWA